MADEGKKQAVELNIDISSDLTGFGSASKPTSDHRRVMKHFASPLLLGPPPSDLLLDLVTHMFTEEEAAMAARLPPLRPRTAETVARKAKRSAEDARRVLRELAYTKRIVLAAGNPERYTLLPLVPGTFEMSLMSTDKSWFTTWHQTFAEFFERLWETGYLADYPGSVRKQPVRYLPVNGVAKTLQMAWPSDLLEEIFEPYDYYAVGHCQCRLVMTLAGKGCNRETETCLGVGPMAKPLVDRGWMRRIDKEEALAIKKNAEKEGSVTWMMNAQGDKRGNVSCSCCGCCCHGLRAVRDFSVPGLISKPHFMPEHDEDACTLCNECVDICPMDAWTVIQDRLNFNRSRCIGCGLCATSCEFDAMTMQPVSDAEQPGETYRNLLLGMTPAFIGNTVKVWAKRLFGKDFHR